MRKATGAEPKMRETGKGCLYINRLQDVHLPMLRKLLTQSMACVRKAAAM